MAWEVLGQIEAHNKNIVMHQTWGHLGADVGRYNGTVLFAVSQYESNTAYVVETKFEGDVDEGPWFYSAVNDFVNARGLEPGIYRAQATYTMCKNGVNKVTGKVKRVKLPA